MVRERNGFMKMSLRLSSSVVLATLLLVAFCSNSGWAGTLGPHTGKEHGFWKGALLILAQVVRYRSRAELGRNAQDNLITLLPLGTLCGEFDVSKHTRMEIRIGVWGDTDIGLPPPPDPGKYVLAVLESGNDKPSSYYISNEGVTFMPNNMRLVDPEWPLRPANCGKTLAKAQKVRYATDLAVVELEEARGILAIG